MEIYWDEIDKIRGTRAQRYLPKGYEFIYPITCMLNSNLFNKFEKYADPRVHENPLTTDEVNFYESLKMHSSAWHDYNIQLPESHFVSFTDKVSNDLKKIMNQNKQERFAYLIDDCIVRHKCNTDARIRISKETEENFVGFPIDLATLHTPGECAVFPNVGSKLEHVAEFRKGIIETFSTAYANEPSRGDTSSIMSISGSNFKMNPSEAPHHIYLCEDSLFGIRHPVYVRGIHWDTWNPELEKSNQTYNNSLVYFLPVENRTTFVNDKKWDLFPDISSDNAPFKYSCIFSRFVTTREIKEGEPLTWCYNREYDESNDYSGLVSEECTAHLESHRD